MRDEGVNQRFQAIKGIYRSAVERLFGLRKRQRDILQNVNRDLEQRNVERIRKRLASK